MGMFDEIRCDYPLPETPDDGKVQFQTKDFDCILAYYRITEEGRLVMKVRWDDTEERNVDHHGFVNFYTCAGDRREGTFKWWEYNAKFTDGQLVSIEGGLRRKGGR
jgi:hypothetical protein